MKLLARRIILAVIFVLLIAYIATHYNKSLGKIQRDKTWIRNGQKRTKECKC